MAKKNDTAFFENKPPSAGNASMGNGQVHEIEVAHQAGVYLESF